MEMEADREVKEREPEEGWGAVAGEEWEEIDRVPVREGDASAPLAERPFLIRSEFPVLSKSAPNAERLCSRDRR